MAVDDATLVATRRGLQAVAEHVLSKALHDATGRIGLRQAPGGFTTPPFPAGAVIRQVGVDGVELVIVDDGVARRSRLSTIGAAAAFVDIDPGAPGAVYRPTSPLAVDAPLALDPAAVAQLARWFALVQAALERLAGDEEATPGRPGAIQLWPEHFDLATSAEEVNLGGSPGDETHPRPYLYVGPWRPPPMDGPGGTSRGAPASTPGPSPTSMLLSPSSSRAGPPPGVWRAAERRHGKALAGCVGGRAQPARTSSGAGAAQAAALTRRPPGWRRGRTRRRSAPRPPPSPRPGR